MGPEHGRAAINEGTPIFGRSAKIVSEWKLHEHAQPTDPARRDTVPGVSRKITFLSPQSVVISRCTVLFLCRLCLTNFNLKDHNGTVLPNLRIGDPPGHLLRSCFNPTHIVRRTQCRTSAKTFDTPPENLPNQKENVNMIVHAPNFASRRVEILEDRCQLGVHPPAKRSQEQRFALLGAEYQVDVQL